MKGLNAFRPSDQTRGAISNAPLVASSESTAVGETGAMGPPSIRLPNATDSSDDETGPSSLPVQPPSVLSSISKRRHSALDDDDNASTSSFGSK